MDAHSCAQRSETCRTSSFIWRRSGSVFDLPGLTRRLSELNQALCAPWDPTRAAMRARWGTEAARISELLSGHAALLAEGELLREWSLEEDSASGALEPELADWSARAHAFERALLLPPAEASTAAIVRVRSGVGGDESADWAQMLTGAYLRWAQRRGLSAELIGEVPAPCGLSSAEFVVRGPDAYSLLRAEGGAHRLVRVSPFDPQRRRQTSFVAVDVLPERPEAEIEIVIAPHELRRDVFRAQGAGGQGVNTTDSAVRLTHLPSGLSVVCQQSRSQIKNTETALSVLRQRLYDLEERRREEARAAERGRAARPEWGRQIRSYVLDRQYVKDHRTGQQWPADGVLGGALDPLLWAGLQWLHAEQRRERGLEATL